MREAQRHPGLEKSQLVTDSDDNSLSKTGAVLNSGDASLILLDDYLEP